MSTFNKHIFRCFIILIMGSLPFAGYAQSYVLNGSAAIYSTDCYRITRNLANQNGTIWYSDPIDLTKPFVIECNLYMGTKDANGADGASFCIQNVGTSALGSNGNGMGYANFSPAFVVEFDTYDNQWGSPSNFDISDDHISFMRDGNYDHSQVNNIAGPVTATSTPQDIENATVYFTRFTWDPTTQLFEVYFNCELRLSANYDIINNIFGGNPMVYWGYTGATGGYFNEQRVCLEENVLTVPDTIEICDGETATLDATGAGINGNYAWTPNYNISDASVQSPDVWPATTTTYYVSYTTPCGFIKTDSILVVVNTTPTQELPVNTSLCSGGSMLVDAGNAGATFNWSTGATSQTITALADGMYSVTVTNLNGCSITDNFTLAHYAPVAANAGTDITICAGSGTTLTASGGTNYVWSTSEVTAAINVNPATVTTYNVTVSDANGCSGTDQVTVSIGTSINFSLGPDRSVCLGDNVIIQAPAGYTYLWSNAQTSQNITVTPTNTQTYTVTLTDGFGCSGTDGLSVTVNPTPIITISNDTAICTGSQVNISASGGSNYLWSNGLSTQQISVTPLATTNYQVTVSTASGCTGTGASTVTVSQSIQTTISGAQTGCPGDNFTLTATGGTNYIWSNGLTGSTINVSPTTTTQYSVTVSNAAGCSGTAQTSITLDNSLSIDIGPDQSICQGNSVTISAPMGYTSYIWSNGATSESITVSPLSSQTYSVSVSSGSSCLGIDEAVVQVNPLPSAYAGLDVTVCNHNPVFLTADGGVSYSWNNGASGQTIEVNPSSNQTYIVTVTDGNGCTSTDQVAVSVFPELHFILTLSDDTVCPGTPLVINSEIYGGMGAPYVVYDNLHQIVTFPLIFTPTESSTLTFTLIDQCNMPLSQTVIINTFPVPPVEFYPDIQSGCAPLTVQFNEQNPDVIGQSYLWDFDDNLNVSYYKNPEHRFNSPGSYDISLTVTNNYGCSSSMIVTNLITVYPLPESRYEANPVMVSIIKPIVNFNNLSTGATEYNWHFGDGDSSSHIAPYHHYQAIGEYETSLIAINQYGCKDTSVLDVNVINESSFYAPSAFSPNSDNNNDLFYVTGNAILPAEFKLCIYDRWGQILWETNSFDALKQISASWDGSSHGTRVPPATYVWYAQYKDYTNTSHFKAGQVTVIW